MVMTGNIFKKTSEINRNFTSQNFLANNMCINCCLSADCQYYDGKANYLHEFRIIKTKFQLESLPEMASYH